MRKKYKRQHGVITVMISMMLVGIMSLGTLVIESGRLQAARTQLDDANLSAGTSMIASYNSTVYERYGLLVIDNENFNLAKYRTYLDFNSDRAVGYMGNNISTMYTVGGAEIEGMYNLTYPAVLKRQLLARAKYNVIPQDYSLNYYNMEHFLSDIQNKATSVSKALKTVADGNAAVGSLSDVPADMQNALKNLHGTFSKIKRYDEAHNITLGAEHTSVLPSVTGTVEHQLPTEDIEAINAAVSDANSILGTNGSLLTSNNGSGYSETDVTLNVSFATNAINDFADLNQLPSRAKRITADCRSMVQGINAAINMLNSDKEGTLLLNSYISSYFSNKNFNVENYSGPSKDGAVKSNSNFAGACVEYVFSGNKSESANQQAAYNYIIATRLVSNLYSVINSSSLFNENNACSVAAHIAWAYYETCADAELLFKYNAVVPYAKYNMILPINRISSVVTAFSSKDFLKGMSALGILKNEQFTVLGNDKTNYRDSLALALWFVPNSKKVMRVADLIQLEMRYDEQYVQNTTPKFLMSEQNTFCRVKCYGNLNSILPVISLGSDGAGIKGTSIQSIKYIGY